MLKKVIWTLIGLFFLVITVVFVLYIYNTKFIEINDAVASAPVNTKHVTIGDEQIAYSEIDNNASTTVLFIGGLSAWNGTWERTMLELNSKKTDLNYIALDLPPFGYSLPSGEKTYFRDVQAKRIAQFIESKNIQNVIIVGHSYSAGPSTEYVLQNQEKVRKLILIAAVLNIDETKVVPKYGPVQFSLLRDVLIGALIHNDAFALSQLKKFVHITTNVDQPLLNVYTRYFETKHVTERLSGWLRDYVNDPLNYLSNSSANYRALTLPVRLIWGDKDTVTPIEGTRILLETVPDIKLQTLIGVGHIPMIEEYTLFDEALLGALSS